MNQAWGNMQSYCICWQVWNRIKIVLKKIIIVEGPFCLKHWLHALLVRPGALAMVWNDGATQVHSCMVFLAPVEWGWAQEHARLPGLLSKCMELLQLALLLRSHNHNRSGRIFLGISFVLNSLSFPVSPIQANTENKKDTNANSCFSITLTRFWSLSNSKGKRNTQEVHACSLRRTRQAVGHVWSLKKFFYPPLIRTAHN